MACRELLMMLVLLLLMVVCFERGAGDFVSDEESLRSALLSNYSTKVRPSFKTYIYTYCVLSSLNHLDIARQSMSVNMLLISVWQDTRLAWNSSLYGGLDTLVTAPEDIWTPPLVIENSVNDVGVIGGKDRDGTPVRILNTGFVSWSPPLEVTTTCEMIISQYPFDTQTCTVIVYGWTPVDTTTMFSPNGEFELKDTAISYSNLGGPAESTIYRKLVLEFTFRRKWQFYGQNLIMPIVLNSILMNAVFALPIESGEKMGYSLTVLLSYVVFLTWVTENLPPVSTDTSILQVYLAVVLCMGCLATLLTTWVQHLYHMSSDCPISDFYYGLASRVLIPFRMRVCCKRWASRQNSSGGNNRRRSKQFAKRGNKLAPVPENPVVEASIPQDVDSLRMFKQNLSSSNGADGVSCEGSDEPGEATRRALTWQEIAFLLDYFFLWVFGVLLVLLTTIIITLLYAKY